MILRHPKNGLTDCHVTFVPYSALAIFWSYFIQQLFGFLVLKFHESKLPNYEVIKVLVKPLNFLIDRRPLTLGTLSFQYISYERQGPVRYNFYEPFLL